MCHVQGTTSPPACGSISQGSVPHRLTPKRGMARVAGPARDRQGELDQCRGRRPRAEMRRAARTGSTSSAGPSKPSMRSARMPNPARGAVRQRRAGRASGHARAFKHARFAWWKNPENLTGRQQAKLVWVAKTDPRLHRAYLLSRRASGWSFSSRARKRRGARGLDRLGATLSDLGLRRPSTPHRQTRGLDPGRGRARILERTHRVG